MKLLLPVHPWPMHEQVEAELAKLGNVKPIEAVPGMTGPILAIGKPPSFVCDAIVVNNPEALPAAVKIVTVDGLKLVTVRDQVRAVFGEDVQEFKADKPASKVRFK